VARDLVLLHGFTNTGAAWRPVVDALRERYRPLVPDLRGHGAASAALPVTLEAVLGDIAVLTDGPFTLAGYSMGGRIALHAALALPERVQRLLLVGAGPGLADAGERAARRAADERLADEIEQSDIESFARRWALTPVLAGLPDTLAARAHEDRLRNSPAALARALRGLGTGALPSLWERLGEVRVPVTLVVGERDARFRQIAQRMADALPAARVAVVPGAGHAVHLEAPRVVAGLLDELAKEPQ
jgi:2-succinyl-6-hydroxy-2,4-cyclohexadiene-1-carboxylate synthase